MLKAHDISISFKDGTGTRQIVSNASFIIDNSDFAFLLGPSGSGKSSLLYVLSLLRSPSSGEILMDDIVISAAKDKAKIRYENFGFVFQHNFLIPYLSVLENICVARRELNIEKEAKELLERLEIANLMNKKPFMLSGGERQRVSIARAVVKKPKILFADEPTASLDQRTAKEVIDIFSELNRSTAIICATHDTAIIPDKARKLYLSNGNVVEGVK